MKQKREEKIVTLIAAMTQPNLAIGNEGKMLYHIPEDLKRFKELTMGHPVVMGRRTFESLPNGALPGRTNYVVTHRKDWHPEGVIVVDSLIDAVNMAHEAEGGENVYVIGGALVFAQALMMADRMELTFIEDAELPEADTYFPTYNIWEWQLEKMPETHHKPGETMAYTFATFVRRGR